MNDQLTIVSDDSRSLRLADSSDFDFVAKVYNESIENHVATMEDTIKSRDDIAAWSQEFNDRECLMIIMARNESGDWARIGWAIIKRYSDRGGYRFAAETALYLTRSQTGRGHGSWAKRHVIEQCRKLGYRHLVAKIFAENTASIRYNEQFGYTIVGRQNRIGFKNGQWKDVVIMQLLIND